LATFEHKLRPIVCVGENLQQREADQTESIIYKQIHACLANLPAQYTQDLVIAYEPIWAIGTGKAATADDAEKVTHFIRQTYTELYGQQAGDAVRILYGGSVTSMNISTFMAQPDIDGALVGGASIKAEFVGLVRQAAASMQQ